MNSDGGASAVSCDPYRFLIERDKKQGSEGTEVRGRH